MHAERIILETDTQGNLINAPKLPANRKVEAIFLVLDINETLSSTKPLRHPHPDIAGQITIKGDVFGSAPDTDWNLPG